MSCYVNSFLKMKCAPDVLGVAGAMKGAAKEISEAMAVRKRLRDIALKHPMLLQHVDLCSGNALAPLLSAFTLPFAQSYACDIRVRNRPWHNVKNFEYLNFDIYDNEQCKLNLPFGDIVLTAIHPCKGLARRVIEVYHDYPQIRHLIMVPCCHGKEGRELPAIIRDKLGGYLAWSFALSQLAEGTLAVDENITSPCNALVIASKE